MTNNEIKYKLIDVEIWLYDFKNFPILLPIKKYKNGINKRYTVNEFKRMESNLKKKIEADGYRTQEIMNPLYFDSKNTVISFDVVKNLKIEKTKKIAKKIIPRKEIKSILKSMKNLFTEHQKRLAFIFKTGKGSLKMIRKNGYFLSEDETLNMLEQKIAQIAEKHIDEILKFLKNNHSQLLLQALQWLPKKYKTINFLIDKLNNSEKNEINFILRQFIPLMANFSKSQKHKISKIIENKILILPSSQIRNKALCILISIINEVSLSKKTINFIKKISQTKQLNCSYPANKIIRALKIN